MYLRMGIIDPIVESVREDLSARSVAGIKKYGMTLEANKLPLREWLQHAYEECLDEALYLKRAMQEYDSTTTSNQ